MLSNLRLFTPRLSGMRTMSSHHKDTSGLRAAVVAKMPSELAMLKELKTKHGEKVIGTCNVTQAIGGMRGVLSMLWETSHLDANEGIRFRGLSIPELQAKLPRAAGGNEPLPEGLFWLLMTGNVPTDAQVKALSKEWAERSTLPKGVVKVIESFPTNMHPMSQFSAAVLALQTDSVFAKKYAAGEMTKTNMWEYCYEDSMNLIARLPEVAATIYRGTFHGKAAAVTKYDHNLDWGANYAAMMGYTKDKNFTDLVRLYLTIHSDHEGGNVSAHTTHLVGSALSDPYLCFSAGLNGLAGPLHGLANQECLKWLISIKEKVGARPMTKELLSQLIWDTLKAGQVVPGYGHAVLRKTDPRFTCQWDFAKRNIKDDEMVKLTAMLYEIVPGILTEHGKTKNPWPNVDCHSGVLLQHYGLKEDNYYTVMFGVSRALGVLAQLTWDRILGLPIERPKSITMPMLRDLCQKMDAAVPKEKM